MKPHMIIKPVHHCGTTCIVKGGAPFCPACDVYVFVNNGTIDVDCTPPEAA